MGAGLGLQNNQEIPIVGQKAVKINFTKFGDMGNLGE